MRTITGLLTLLLLVNALGAVTLSSGDVSDFVTEFTSKYTKSNNVPGWVCSIQQNFAPILEAAYGKANVKEDKSMSFQKSKLQVGDISSVITTIGVLQQKDKGNLELFSDVNTYLKKVKAPSTYAASISTENLLLHTSGIDFRQLNTESFSKQEKLQDYFYYNMPAVVRPPGLRSYNPVASALAAQVVVDVSDADSYQDYVDSNIFAPLGMKNSKAAATEDDFKDSDYSTSYVYHDVVGESAVAPAYSNIFPAKGMLTQGPDMSILLNFLLLSPSYNGSILSTASKQLILSRQFQASLFTSDGAGFTSQYFSTRNNDTMLQVTGQYQQHACVMLLIPSEKIGVFFYGNADGATAAVQDFLSDFLNKFFPTDVSTPVPKPPSGFSSQRGRSFTGTYRSAAYEHLTILRLSSLWAPSISVQPQSNNSLGITFDYEWTTRGPTKISCNEIDQLVFRCPNLDSLPGVEILVTFIQNPSEGSLDFLYFQDYLFENVAINNTSLFTVIVLLLIVVVMSTSLLWPIVDACVLGFWLVRVMKRRRAKNIADSYSVHHDTAGGAGGNGGNGGGHNATPEEVESQNRAYFEATSYLEQSNREKTRLVLAKADLVLRYLGSPLVIIVEVMWVIFWVLLYINLQVYPGTELTTGVDILTYVALTWNIVALLIMIPIVFLVLYGWGRSIFSLIQHFRQNGLSFPEMTDKRPCLSKLLTYIMRLHFTIVVLAMLIFAGFMGKYLLIGYNFPLPFLPASYLNMFVIPLPSFV